MDKRRKLINKITKLGIFSAIAVVLYELNFPLPIFPSFLKVNFSMMAIILVGLMYGPLDAVIVVIVRFIIGIITTHTGGVGEISDLIIGVLTIVPSSLIYQFNRTKKGGYIALGVTFIMWIISGTLSNLVTIPIYVKILTMDKVIIAISAIIPGVTAQNYLSKYILFGALPFNILIAMVVCVVTLFLYKHISNIFKYDFFSKRKSKKDNKKKIMVMIDSFKGTLTSSEANGIVKEKLKKKGYIVDTIPISDGGDGFLDTMQKIVKGPFLACMVNDAIFRNHQARYLYDESCQTAYIEMAECCGIQKLSKGELNAFTASSYGLGEQIKYIVEHHKVNKLVVGIGGSASSDVGSGMLEALGAKFYNQNNKIITKMNNQKLSEVEKIDFTEAQDLVKNIEIEVLTDVTNPLLGERGAVYVFAPQKGATQQDLPQMESNVVHFVELIKKTYLPQDLVLVDKEGAAGGVGFAFNQILKAKLLRGSDKILSLINFSEICKNYDIIITGEGKFDEQTMDGKLIKGILTYNPTKLIILTGIAEITTDKAYVFAIVPTICDLETSLNNPQTAFEQLVDKLPL